MPEMDYLSCDAVPHIIWTMTPDGRGDYYNACAMEYLGKPLKDLREGWRHAVHPDDQDNVAAAWEAACRADTGSSVVCRLRRASDGEYVWHTARFAPESSEDGVVTRWWGIAVGIDVEEVTGVTRDITRRTQAEHALRASEEQLRTALNAANLGTWDYDFRSGTLYWDERCRVIFGVGSGDIIDFEAALNVLHPDDREHTAGKIDAALAPSSDGSFVDEYRVVHPDGSVRWVLSNGRVYFEGEGDQRHAARFTGTLQDITDRKQAEEDLRRSEKQAQEHLAELRSIYASAPVALSFIDKDLKYRSINQKLAQIHGLPQDEINGRPIREVLSKELADSVEPFLRRVIETGKPVINVEVRGETRGQPGRERTWLLNYHPVRDASQRVLGAVVVGLDITQRKRTEEALGHRQRQQEVIAELGQKALVERDLQSLFGRAVADIARTLDIELCKVLELLPNGQEVLLRAGVGWNEGLVGHATVDTGLQSQAGYTLHSDSPVIVDDLRTESRFNGPPLLTEHGVVSGMSCIIRVTGGRAWGVLGAHTTTRRAFSRDDVNFLQAVANILGAAIGRRETENELHDSERRWALAVEASRAGVYERSYPIDEKLYFSERFGEIFGLRPDEMPPWDEYEDWLADRLHPEDVQHAKQASQVFQEGLAENLFIEPRIRHENGQWLWLRVLAHASERDDQGRVRRAIGAMLDITDLKQAEQALMRSNEQLEIRVKERTAELEDLSQRLRLLASELSATEQRERQRLAEVIHDHLQQLLVAAKMRTSAVLRKANADQDRDSLDLAVSLLDQAISESRSLTAQLRPPALYESGLVSALRWLAGWMEETHGLKVWLDLDSAAEPDLEHGAVFLFESVRELLLNAVKYADIDEARVSLCRFDGDRLCLSVSDKGRGFDTAALTKQRSDTGGFGLFSIKERLRVMGGELEMVSKPGVGTTMRMYLPANAEDEVPKVSPEAASSSQQTEPRQEDNRSTANQIRVLLADDHAIVRQGIASILKSAADIVVIDEVADGQAAVDAARSLKPDVAVLDVNMPTMNGLQAARIINEEDPGVEIIGLSVHDDNATKQAMLDAGASAYLLKDGPADVLLDTIRRCADKRGEGDIQTQPDALRMNSSQQ